MASPLAGELRSRTCEIQRDALYHLWLGEPLKEVAKKFKLDITLLKSFQSTLPPDDVHFLFARRRLNDMFSVKEQVCYSTEELFEAVWKVVAEDANLMDISRETLLRTSTSLSDFILACILKCKPRCFLLLSCAQPKQLYAASSPASNRSRSSMHEKWATTPLLSPTDALRALLEEMQHPSRGRKPYFDQHLPSSRSKLFRVIAMSHCSSSR